MAKTKFILEADEAKAVQAFLKVVEATGKAAGGTRRLSREGSKLKRTFADIGKIGAGFFTAQMGIEGARRALGFLISEFEDLKRKQAEAAAEGINYAKSFSETIGTWLGVEQIDKADEALTKLVKKMPQLSHTLGRELLAAYGGAYPESTLEQGLEAVRLAVPLIWENRPELLKFVAKIQRRMPEKEIEDIFDAVIEMRKRAGQGAEQLTAAMKGVTQLLQYGISNEEALGTVMAMLEQDLKPRAITTGIGLLARDVQPIIRPLGQRLTEKERVQNEIAAIREGLGPTEAGAATFQWMRENPEKAKLFYGTTFAPLASLFAPGVIARNIKLVRTAQAEDVYKKSVQAGLKQKLVTRVTIQEEQDAAKELLKLGWGEGAAVSFTRDYIEEILKSMPSIGATKRKLLTGIIEIEGLVGNEYVKTATKRLTALQQKAATKTLSEEFDPLLGYIEGYGYKGPRPNPYYDPALAQALQGLIDRLQRMAETYGQGEGGTWEETIRKLDRAAENLNQAAQIFNQMNIVPLSRARLID